MVTVAVSGKKTNTRASIKVSSVDAGHCTEASIQTLTARRPATSPPNALHWGHSLSNWSLNFLFLLTVVKNDWNVWITISAITHERNVVERLFWCPNDCIFNGNVLEFFCSKIQKSSLFERFYLHFRPCTDIDTNKQKPTFFHKEKSWLSFVMKITHVHKRLTSLFLP